MNDALATLEARRAATQLQISRGRQMARLSDLARDGGPAQTVDAIR